MANSRARLEDLQWLADTLDTDYRLLTQHRLLRREDDDRYHRLMDWMAVMIDARIARLTQPEPAHHRAMMEAFDAAVTKWQRDRESVASDYPGDLAIYDEEHPKPSLKTFMIQQAQRAELVQQCDCPVTVDHSVHCPLHPDFQEVTL